MTQMLSGKPETLYVLHEKSKLYLGQTHINATFIACKTFQTITVPLL